MNLLTRFFIGWNKIIKTILTKNKLLKKNFLSYLIALFFGFIFGNLFGTIISSIRQFHIWDGFLIIILLLLCETINWVVYQKKRIIILMFRRPFRILFNFVKNKINKKTIRFHSLLNAFKAGLLLGFFIDAFKVGS